MSAIGRRRRWITFGVITLLLVLLIFFYSLRGVLWPFIFAFFIAYILDPWVEFLQRKRLPRLWAVLLVFSVFTLCLILAAILLVPPISHEFSVVAQKFPGYVDVVRSRLAPWFQEWLAEHSDIRKQVENYFNTNLKQKIPGLLSPVLRFFGSMFSGIVNFVVGALNVLLVPVLAFYMVKDFPTIKERCMELIPPRYVDKVALRIREVDAALSEYLRGQLTVSLALAFIYTTGLLILRVPLAIPIGLFSGLANMVPYLGFILGIGMSMLLSFVDSQDWHRLIWILVVYAFAQLMEGTWIGPLVVGKRTGLHPVIIMLSLVIGGTLFGFMGMLLAVPFMAVAGVFVRTAYESYLNSDWYQHQKEEARPKAPLPE